MNLKKKITSFLKDKKEFRLAVIIIVVLIGALTIRIFFSNTFSRITEAPNNQSTSRLENNTLYVDDLAADYHYLKGLNYTEIRSTSIPSGNSTGYFDNDHLVKVTIIYDGKDINNSSLVGTVSPINNETANKYVYYKYFALERNSNGTLATDTNNQNYIRIELIDNPFSKRPYVNSTEYGFNGWVCNQANDTTANLCSNSTIDIDTDDYTRHMNVPISNESEITIHLNASWYEADVVTSAGDISYFNSMSMQSIAYTTTETITHYYNAYWKQNYAQMVYRTSYNYNAGYLPVGVWYRTSRNSGTYNYVSQANSVRADRWWGNTTYYVFDADPDAIVANTQYTGGSYTFIPNFNPTGSNTEVTINTYDDTYMNFIETQGGTYTHNEQIQHNITYLPTGANTAGFYYQVSNPTTAQINTGEYYNASGTKCTSANSCTTAYKLIQTNDSLNKTNGNSISIIESTSTDTIDAQKYYFLVTRDLNIFRYTSTTRLNISNIEVNKPFTVTGTAINGTSTSGILNLNSSDFTAANDIVIENIKIYGPNSAGTKNITAGNDSKTSNVIYANSHNLKIGRNVTSSRNANYLVAESILGGTTSALSGTFKVIIESGKYYSYHSGTMNGSSNYTFNQTTVLGNDYDRVVTTNKDKVKFLIGLDGYTGGKYTAGSDSLFASYTVFKSGLYGYNDDGTPNNDTTAGMYIGGYNGLIVNSLTGVKIEGGDITYATGGYGYNGSADTNSTYIGMSGGTIRSIYGGAGYSTTKGNRIINVTGGTVSYSILGGSDSYSSSSTTDGEVDGDTLIYVGGTAYVGGGTGTVQGVEAGNVFGAGGGNSNSTQKGTVRNSHIIINGGTITNSVYGGGNHGSTGTQSSSAATTKIDIYAGTIGDVYGGSKSAGFSKSNYANSSTIDINVSGGTITNVYGGSNEKGQIYGSIDIDITGGTITNNIYGGGKGAQTFVSNNVDITIGTTGGGNVPTISGSAYGGSALGTVNGDTASSTATSTTTKVTVKSGIIGSVFGGGQGDTSNTTPYVRGNVTVTVDGGTITNVYGGNDLKGTPSGTVTVNINGGTVTSAYAGGNQTSVTTPYINVTGGTVTNAFGGGNNGTVTTSHITVTGGTVTNAYGGGNNAGVTTTNLSLTGGTVTNSYGGGNNAGATTTNVTLNGSSCTKVFGGSNASGTVTTSNVTCTSGSATSIYGGNNLGGTTATTNVIVNGGTITNAYGGGEKTDVTTQTNVTINNTVENVYGGSNTSGTVAQTNVAINANTTNTFGGNNIGGTTTTSNVNINSGGFANNVFGGNNLGGNTITSHVNMNIGGFADNVFGGNNLGGTTITSNVNIQGSVIGNTYGGGLKATTTTSNVNLLYGYSKNIYGGGSEAGVTTTNVNIANGYAENIFGGSNKSGDITNSYIKNINSSVTTNNNLTATISKATSTINQINATDIESSETLTVNITNNTGVNLPTWDAYIITSDAIFDSNWSGTNVTAGNGIFHADEVNQWYGTNPLNNGNTHQFSFNIHSTVSYDDFKIIGYLLVGEDSSHNKYFNYQFENNKYAEKILGGNNAGGVTSTSHVNLTKGRYGSVYGGGEKAVTGVTNVTISTATVENVVYGGGDQAQVNTDTNITINQNAQILGDVFGGGNEGKVAGDTNITINTASITKNVYGGGNKAVVDGTTIINGNHATVGENVYGGGNEASIGEDANVTLIDSTITQNIYGGGNKAKVTGDTNVTTTRTTVSGNIYGGGNEAHIEGNTNIDLISSTIEGSTFGGGNNGMVFQNTTTIITNTEIGGSAYAGGNGQTATVIGNNKINVEGTSEITEHVFGGGNAAETGCTADKEDTHGNLIVACSHPNTSTSTVNIAGATIGGNVYGGANTSVVYGETFVNIGKNTIQDNLTKGNIDIDGNVFGGGEANAAGSEDYDFNFISVTRGINIHIDANTHTSFDIDGSIFGSGNASSSGGYSYINIDNYGTLNNPANNISIQRTDIVTLNNSSIKLEGAKDRTNKYKNELFTLSRIGELKLKNNSNLFLEKGANLLENFSSLVDINGEEHEAIVTINKNNGTVTKNVDNRVYMIEGKNLNISDDESLATYGDVIGMTFFGMFKIDRNGNIATGRYSSSYNYGSSISGSEQYYFSSGSYVVGKHKSNHITKEDGFYSNFPNEDGSKIIVDYIEPTPSDATYYRWVIGEAVETLEVNITASKYSTLGTTELQLRDYYHPNTQLHILGVNYDGLASDINLLESDDIPRHASSAANANTNYGLAIKSGNTGWITRGTTEFLTDSQQDIKGTTAYLAENSNAIPSFVFYFYHSKNITETKSLGTVVISLMVETPIDDLNNRIQRINLEVNLNTALYEGDNYEASIAPGAQYELFANSSVNITTKSTFSTYFSLYSESATNIYRPGYTRSLVSSYALPENTKITMIDFASSSTPEYYYYIIDSATYQQSVQNIQLQGETSYHLSSFIRMGSSSSNNNYNDATANSHYYNSTNQVAEEEFIFIVDLKDTTLNTNVLNQSLLLELRDTNNNPVIPVLDISQQRMFYNLYTNKEAVISSTATLSNNNLYIGKSIDLSLITSFAQQTVGNITIIDTNYYEKKLGIKLSLYNSNNQLINGAGLLGTTFIYNGVSYFPSQDGTVRFNIAESVANVSSRIKIDTTSSNIPSGEYKLVIDTFGSSDGIYYGVNPTTRIEKNITIVNEIFGLDATMSDEDVIIDKDTGLSQDKNNYLDFQINYSSGLRNPNIRLSLYRRTYNDSDAYDYSYNLVDIKDYISNELTTTTEQKVYLIRDMPTNRFQYIMTMKDNLKTGTYQVRFNLYDGNNYVGHINKYIIIE
ncbi:MAG: hypothetical protein IKF19_00320 [Bacilli bacterium]|nr:hypothetical protein [Bacilli bacterium]